MVKRYVIWWRIKRFKEYVKEKSNHHILQETIETTVETKEPSIFQKNNEKQVDNQKVDSKSLAKVLSDVIFVIIGQNICHIILYIHDDQRPKH